jgi:hypothetical protein
MNIIAAKICFSSESITAAIDRRARIVHLCGDGCKAIACAFAGLLRNLGLTVQWLLHDPDKNRALSCNE